MLKTIQRILVALLFFLLPFHAVLMNTLQFRFGIDLPLNAWKEGLIILLSGLILLDIIFSKVLIRLDFLDWTLIGFFILGILSAVFQTGVFSKALYGFKYDMEFLWLFFILRHSLFINETWMKRLITGLLITGGIVLLFGFLQAFILPKDFMTFFGYSRNVSSWLYGDPLPMYHGIHAENNIIRISSTFSGPNQFAMYSIFLCFLFFFSFWKYKTNRFLRMILLCFAGLAFFNLLFTFSRSALLGFLGAAFLLSFFYFWKYQKKWVSWIVGVGIFICLLLGTLFTFNTGNIQEIFLREGSTNEHIKRSYNGIEYVLKNPWGYGIGSAGPASSRFDPEERIGWIPENWYLQIMLEMGILGGIIFIVLIASLCKKLYRHFSFTKDYYTLSLCASIIGISLACLFLHAWEDSATALTLFGLSGIFLSYYKSQVSDFFKKIP